MATRFGFMTSNKPGKCFYCRADLAVGERCAMDNNVKRRTCAPCAERKIDDGNVEQTVEGKAKPKLFAGVTDDWKPAFAALQTELAELKKLILNALGDESTS